MTKFDVMATIDRDFAQSFDRKPSQPYFVASECGNHPCTERWCPYTHGSGWAIDGMPGLYNSEADALAAFSQWKPAGSRT
jgi:hypothetical protein